MPTVNIKEEGGSPLVEHGDSTRITLTEAARDAGYDIKDEMKLFLVVGEEEADADGELELKAGDIIIRPEANIARVVYE